ncbi:hypothetical protein [Mucilaginibacter sp.]|uniref:hypothetical protein n=1 Tax=Mucilaginibacter sp. TaxID=1882438 RepID=UPI002604DE2D|nr:hypothetical protein [Mucilaginibacter sp.]MDB5129801.1 hypothetical protein [Mucilaginibacter sp.]
MTKEKKERLEYKVFTRIGRKKYDELIAMLDNSDSRTISALLRDILEHQKIIIHTHDNTLDKTMEELSGVRKELQAMGVNINQATRKLHQTDFNTAELTQAQEILNGFQHTEAKINVLFELIDNLSEKWLPK